MCVCIFRCVCSPCAFFYSCQHLGGHCTPHSLTHGLTAVRVHVRASALVSVLKVWPENDRAPHRQEEPGTGIMVPPLSHSQNLLKQISHTHTRTHTPVNYNSHTHAHTPVNHDSHTHTHAHTLTYTGHVSSDIFNTRIIKPPTSVVVFPLKGEGQEVFGVVYCLSCVNSNFSDISSRLREICVVGGHTGEWSE